MKKLWLFIPAYNVAGSFQWLTRRLLALKVLLEGDGYELKTLVINDCSTDDTGKLYGEFSGSNPFLEVRTNETNMRNAYNIIKGYEWALTSAGEDDLIACLDGDGEHEPTSVWECLDLIQKGKCDGVIGCIPYPRHFFRDPADLDAMLAVGALQASSMSIENPFIPQSPGYHVCRTEFARAAIAAIPRYRAYWEGNMSGILFPDWGMHYVIDRLSVMAGAKMKVRYLTCNGEPPNRTVEKRTRQMAAALHHIELLHHFDING